MDAVPYSGGRGASVGHGRWHGVSSRRDGFWWRRAKTRNVCDLTNGTRTRRTHETRCRSYQSYQRASAVPFASDGAMVAFPGAGHATLHW